jgi:3-(3-hydroxy-phenyl)propionate hydroxylase
MDEIMRGKAAAHLHGADKVAVHSLEDTMLAAFAPALQDWLTANAGDAVLVRPDRYVFGTGSLRELLDAYRAALGGKAKVSPERSVQFS